jgi:hypothetical protein
VTGPGCVAAGAGGAGGCATGPGCEAAGAGGAGGCATAIGSKIKATTNPMPVRVINRRSATPSIAAVMVIQVPSFLGY